MKITLSSSVWLTACMTLGLGFATATQGPSQSPRAVPNRNTNVVLCAHDECDGEKDFLIETCLENRYPVGQMVPTTPVPGLVCVCPCPDLDP